MISRFPTLILFFCCIATSRAADRPNILWLVSEDNAAYTVGAYGDPLTRTPNLDKLAANSIVFDHAYSSSAVCAPTRSSIITGRYACSMGTQHMRSDRALPEGVKFFPEFLRAAGYCTTNHAKTDYNTSTSPAAAWNENGKDAHWRHRNAEQPFFAVFNFENSHESKLHQRAKLITDPAKVRVPADLPDTPTVREDLAQYYDCVSNADAALGKVLDELTAEGLAENTIIFYYGDHGGAVSRSKRFLYENGTHPPLIVHFPAKYQHLAPAPAGTHFGELVNFVDLAPTVLSLAGVPQPAQFQGRAFAGPARKEPPAFTFMFRDRMDERYDLARAVTDGRYRYIRNYYPNQPWGQHLDYLFKQASMKEWESLFKAGKLNPTQRAFFEPKPAEELFDCEADPDNVKNLANDPAQKSQLEKLRDALRNKQLAMRDTGFMPEPLMIDWAQKASPATVAGNDEKYPLAKLLGTIDSLQLTTEADSSVMEKALHDPNPLLRYWAAVAALNAKNQPDLTSLLKDEQPIVRLAAAEVILKHAANDAAWRIIEDVLKLETTESNNLPLFALNVVARIQRPFPESMKGTLTKMLNKPSRGKGENYTARALEDLLKVETK